MHTHHHIQLSCIQCEADVAPLEEEQTATCALCGQEFEAVSICQNNHFVCHDCRQKEARERILRHCLQSDQTQPYALMQELMRLPNIAMHGPEHHLLLTAALLTATCNQTGREDLQELLEQANERSLAVPGGACGIWGICGAAVGAGIFVSLLTETTPESKEEWGDCGELTAACGHAIASLGGPRCCKRDSFTSFVEAATYANSYMGVDFSIPDTIACSFFTNNPDCKGRECPYLPVKKQSARAAQ